MVVRCNLVLSHKDLKIINIDAPSFCNSGLYRSQSGQVLWLVTPTWCLRRDTTVLRGLARLLADPSDRQSVCVLINEVEDADSVEQIPGVEFQYVNHNALSSIRQFAITGAEKIYDAVANARPLRLKRVHLCAKIDNLCCVRLMEGVEGEDYFDAASLNPRFINHETLSIRRVAHLLNQSYCGVILSAIEGACYASTEYLYCGLPVVSTESEGGRDVWYDSENSIIVEADADSVREGVDYLKRRLLDNSISPLRIRENALKLRARFLETAQATIAMYLARFGLSEEISAANVMRDWLTEIDMNGYLLKAFGSEADAAAYLEAGNSALWRTALNRADAGRG